MQKFNPRHVFALRLLGLVFLIATTLLKYNNIWGTATGHGTEHSIPPHYMDERVYAISLIIEVVVLMLIVPKNWNRFTACALYSLYSGMFGTALSYALVWGISAEADLEAMYATLVSFIPAAEGVALSILLLLGGAVFRLIKRRAKT